MVSAEYYINPLPDSYSRFKQQKLRAWQPILTIGSVLPTFFIVGAAFIPIGIVLLNASNSVQEFVLDYTDTCFSKELNAACRDYIRNFSFPHLQDCHCSLTFQLTETMQKPVFLYYGLTNFYQNHRRYVKSRDDSQLLGKPLQTSSDCEPFRYDNGTPIAPCGAIANSMFNDSLILAMTNGSLLKFVPVSYEGIAWESDLAKKFRNPPGPLQEAFAGTSKPPGWSKPIYELSDIEAENGFQNESFIVWMRTAALPNFRKLQSRVLHDSPPFSDGLPRGNYTLHVTYNFPVSAFDGRKRFIISTASWAGGQNPFLGIAYLIVGSACILMGIVFSGIHMKFGRSLTEMATIG